jgi:hypothetical protein
VCDALLNAKGTIGERRGNEALVQYFSARNNAVDKLAGRPVYLLTIGGQNAQTFIVQDH